MKKIAVSTVKAYMKSLDTSDTFEVPIGDDGFVLTFKKSLTIDEKNAFIERVMSACFDIFGEYHPETFDPMFNATILQFCSNAPTLAKPKAKKDGDKEDAEPLLDIDAMSNFYNAIHSYVIKAGGDDFEGFEYEMRGLCQDRLSWLKNLRPERYMRPIAQTCGNIDALLGIIGSIASSLLETIENTDTDELVKYAKAVTDSTNGLNEETLVKNMFKVYEGAKKEQAEEDDSK